MVLVSTAGLNDILRQIFLAGSKYETHFFFTSNNILKFSEIQFRKHFKQLLSELYF